MNILNKIRDFLTFTEIIYPSIDNEGYGHWVNYDYTYDFWECSNCKKTHEKIYTPYCPYCGIKMKYKEQKLV